MEKRKELRKTLQKIVVYVIVMSVFENIYDKSDSQAWRIIPSGFILIVLLIGMAKDKSFSKYGFYSDSKLPNGRLLYLLPLIILATANLWHGIVMRYSPMETVFYICSMIFIGFIEEILFRGYLLRLLMKNSVRMAIIVSSLTFGIGHIVNVLNGADMLSTGLQVVYAISIGVMLSVFVVRTNNILPCCVFHGVFNALAAFSNEAGITITYQIATCVVITVISLGYAWYVWTRKEAEAA